MQRNKNKKEGEKTKGKYDMILWEKKLPKMTLTSFSVDHVGISVGMQPTLKSSLFPQWGSLGGNYFFIYKWLSVRDIFHLYHPIWHRALEALCMLRRSLRVHVLFNVAD